MRRRSPLTRFVIQVGHREFRAKIPRWSASFSMPGRIRGKLEMQESIEPAHPTTSPVCLRDRTCFDAGCDVQDLRYDDLRLELEVADQIMANQGSGDGSPRNHTPILKRNDTDRHRPARQHSLNQRYMDKSGR